MCVFSSTLYLSVLCLLSLSLLFYLIYGLVPGINKRLILILIRYFSQDQYQDQDFSRDEDQVKARDLLHNAQCTCILPYVLTDFYSTFNFTSKFLENKTHFNDFHFLKSGVSIQRNVRNVRNAMIDASNLRNAMNATHVRIASSSQWEPSCPLSS